MKRADAPMDVEGEVQVHVRGAGHYDRSRCCTHCQAYTSPRWYRMVSGALWCSDCHERKADATTRPSAA